MGSKITSTSGYVPGGTDVAVADGGTGASTRTGAQTNLGILSSRVSTQFDKTNNTLANVTGLSLPVLAGVAYHFDAWLDVAADATGSAKVAIAGTATATSVAYWVHSEVDGTVSLARAAALGGSINCDAITGTTSGMVEIHGTIVVNAGGTLTVQFAQQSASGTSSVLVGSVFVAKEIP